MDDGLGISESTYHFGAVYIGSIFGIMTLIGMLLLTARRLTISNVRKLSSASDIFVNFLLILIIFMGCFSTLVTNAMVTDFDYRQTISIWFRHLFTFSPNAALMTGVPLSFKIHILLGFTILACWPFTRLVHVWSIPLAYTNRRYIVYRKHKSTSCTLNIKGVRYMIPEPLFEPVHFQQELDTLRKSKL